jgi:hypothetical protein
MCLSLWMYLGGKISAPVVSLVLDCYQTEACLSTLGGFYRTCTIYLLLQQFNLHPGLETEISKGSVAFKSL